MAKYFDYYLRKLLAAFLLIVFSLAGLGQNVGGGNCCHDFRGCDTLSISEKDSVFKYNGNGEMNFYYSNGKMKYKAFKKRGKEHKIYYYPTGVKCKEEILNFKLKIKKTIFYDTLEKKQMVCKGSLKF